jgi:hypothetical protein
MPDKYEGFAVHFVVGASLDLADLDDMVVAGQTRNAMIIIL